MAHSLARIGLLLSGSIQTIVSRSRSPWRVYAMRSLPALVAAVLVVLGSIAAEAVVSSPFGFLGEMRGAENQLTQGLASSAPTPDSGGGTVVANVTVGNSPQGVAHDSGNGYVYVANWGSDTVTVIDGTTVVATVPVGRLPRGVGYNGENGYVYVANQGSNTVTVIDGTTVVATVPVGNNPFGVGYNSGNGYVYVANYFSNTVSVISGTALVANVTVGTYPEGVGYNSGNGYVYVANSVTGNTVTVIDGTTVVATVPVGNNPFGVGYNGGNGDVYVANAGSNTVSVISTIGPSSPVLSGLDPAILATILVAIGAVGVAVALIAWKRRKAGRPPPEGAP